MEEKRMLRDLDPGKLVYTFLVAFIVLIFAVEYVSFENNLKELGFDFSAVPPHGETGGAIEKTASLAPESGQMSEGTAEAFPFSFEKSVLSLHLVLEWTDEADNPPLINQPDTFQVTIESPSGKVMKGGPSANPQGGEGKIDITHNSDVETGELGIWTVTVTLVDCGDQEGFVRTESDDGNSYALSISYTYLELETPEAAS